MFANSVKAKKKVVVFFFISPNHASPKLHNVNEFMKIFIFFFIISTLTTSSDYHEHKSRCFDSSFPHQGA